MKKIIVSGATSMIGLELVKLMVSECYTVIALVRPFSIRNDKLLQFANVEIVQCELGKYSELPVIYDVAGFFHLAWDASTDRDNYYAQIRNIEYTLDAVKYAEKCNCSFFLGTGSQAEYGIIPAGTKLSGGTSVNPESGYGIAKYAAGRMAINYCNQLKNMRCCWTRILSVYGNGDRANSLVSYVMNGLLNNKVIELSPCQQIWDYLYVKDAASALYAIFNSGKAGNTYVIGSGKGRLLSEYVYEIQSIIGKKGNLKIGAKEYAVHQPMYMVADLNDLIHDTGWQPRYSFSEGMCDMLQCSTGNIKGE